MSRSLRTLSPGQAVERLEDVDLAALHARGKRLVLLDVDNTCLPFRGDEISESVVRWIGQGRELGFRFCFISNTKRLERLQRLAEAAGVDWVKARFKPSRRMFVAALERHGVPPEAAVMVGDQLLTDVFGANRAKIEAIWVRPLNRNEFMGTRLVSRKAEYLLTRRMHKYLDEDAAAEAPFLPMWGPLRSRTVRQFAKFLVVGGSSFVITYCIQFTLMYAVPWGEGNLLSEVAGTWLVEQYPQWFGGVTTNKDAFVPIASVLAAPLAILNSYYWNRRWTWRILDKEEQHAQLVRFFALSITMSLMAVGLTWLFHGMLPADLTLDPATDSKNRLRIAVVLATAIQAVGNFVGQRFFAFRGKAG